MLGCSPSARSEPCFITLRLSPPAPIFKIIATRWRDRSAAMKLPGTFGQTRSLDARYPLRPGRCHADLNTAASAKAAGFGRPSTSITAVLLGQGKQSWPIHTMKPAQAGKRRLLMAAAVAKKVA